MTKRASLFSTVFVAGCVTLGATPSFSQLGLLDCEIIWFVARDGGESDHRNLGNNTISYRDYFFPACDFDFCSGRNDLVVEYCQSGQSVNFSFFGRDVPSLSETQWAELAAYEEVVTQEFAQWASAGAADLAQLVANVAASTTVRSSNVEPVSRQSCGCAIAYPEARQWDEDSRFPLREIYDEAVEFSAWEEYRLWQEAEDDLLIEEERS